MIKKVQILSILLCLSGFMQAQYSYLDGILTRLEERRGINKDLKDVSIDGKRFILVKEAEDHTERDFVSFNNKTVTYVEVFDDKKNNESTSNIFTGDFIRTNKNIISIRCDYLEGKKIPVAITRSFLLTKQGKIVYLVDTNTAERWIDEKSFGKAGKHQ